MRKKRGRTLVENQFRFGVFLRPDPKTCAAVTQITGQLRAQYGLISAGAFPPHVTLAGSLPVVVPLAELIQLIGFVLRRTRSLPVQNLGIRRLADAAIAYDVSVLDGAPNKSLNDLAGAVDSVVRPLVGPSGELAPDLYEPDRWMPHISLVSHEMRVRADLREEMQATMEESAGICACCTSLTVAKSESPRNSRRPASISQRMIPTAKMSVR